MSRTKGVTNRTLAGRIGAAPARRSVPVVAFGSCAGGLKSIRAILAKLPSDCGMALVVIQHRDPARRSVLRSLLSNVPPFPVLEIFNGIALQPNRVYVVPPHKKASIRNGTFSLESITRRETDQPVDDFMADLAWTLRDKAIGVVLSGKGSDGSRGLAAIKAAKGITFAQDPKTAPRPDMPTNAIKAGNVDFVLPPAQIALELGQLAGSAYKPLGLGSPDDGSVAAGRAMGRDITERKRMEQAIRQREQALTTLLDNSPDTIVQRDRNLRNLYVNATWERLTGISREKALGKTSQELGKQADVVRLQKRTVRQILKTRRPATIAFTYDSPHGPIDYEVRYIPELVDGRVTSFLLIGRDVTEQKRLQTLAAANERDIRALSASLITAQEQERRRLAREIHDSLCQHLGALATEIGGIAAEFPASSSAGQRLQAARKRALRAAEEARQIASQLHPAILEDLGLPRALRDLCREFSRREGVPVKLRLIDPLPEAPIDTASCVYRIAQEALNNIAKHSHAKNIWVRLTGTPHLRLRIRDDGIGFDPDAVRGSGGLGLISMEERARIAGAKLSIRGRPGQGVIVDLVMLERGATREKSAHSAGG